MSTDYADLAIPDFLNRKLHPSPSGEATRVILPAPAPAPVDNSAARAREIAETERQIARLEAYVRRIENGPVPEHPQVKFKQDRTLDTQEQIIRSLKGKLQRLKEAQ